MKNFLQNLHENGVTHRRKWAMRPVRSSASLGLLQAQRNLKKATKKCRYKFNAFTLLIIKPGKCCMGSPFCAAVYSDGGAAFVFLCVMHEKENYITNMDPIISDY